MDIPVVGRVGDKPELMKPNAWSLLEVISKLNCCSDDVIFIGDTQRDYLCAKNVGCKFIGLAPTERKKQKLLNVISESDIVSDYYELVKCLGV